MHWRCLGRDELWWPASLHHRVLCIVHSGLGPLRALLLAVALLGLALLGVWFAWGPDEAAPREPQTAMDARASGTPSSSSTLEQPGGLEPGRTGAIEPGAAPFRTTPPVQEAPGLTETAAWEAEFRGLTRDQLLEMRNALKATLDEAKAQEFELRFSTGSFITVGTGLNYSFSDWDQRLISQVRMPNTEDGPILKDTLPPTEYPELYALRRKLKWLEDATSRLHLEEVVVK